MHDRNRNALGGLVRIQCGKCRSRDLIAANAFTTTTITTATASFTWGIIEKIFRGKASVLGFCSGAVAGLVVITPACGFVNATGAVILGVAAAVLPYLAVSKLKAAFGYDDALDTFGVHGIGEMTGALGTGLLATKAVNSNLKDELLTPLFLSQCAEILVTLILSAVATAVIALALRGIIGLRPSADVETAGLDLSEHGEEAYID